MPDIIYPSLRQWKIREWKIRCPRSNEMVHTYRHQGHFFCALHHYLLGFPNNDQVPVKWNDDATDLIKLEAEEIKYYVVEEP